MTSRALAIFVVALGVHLAFSRKIIYDRNRPWFQEEGNPGAKVRLTEQGLNYMRQVAVLIMNEQIPQIKDLTASGEFGDATIKLSKINVTNWRPADYTLLRSTPPNKLVFGLENADLGIESDFVAIQKNIQLPGQIIGEAQGLTVATEVETIYNDGGITIEPTSCKAVIQKSTFEVIPDPDHALAGLVKPHIPAMNNAIRAFLPTIFCQTAQSILKGAGPNLFSAEKLNIPLSGEIKEQVNVDAGAIKDPEAAKFAESATEVLLDGAIIDMTMTRPPISTFEYLETHHKGDIYYADNEYYRTPFEPRPMPSFPDVEKMLYVQMSDYSINALLYQLYLNDKLTMTFDPATAPADMANFLRTTCEGGASSADDLPSDPENVFANVCLGSLLPSLHDAYPDKNVYLVFVPHGVPDFKFTSLGGVLSMQGRLFTYVKTGGKLEQVLVSNVDMRSDVPLAIKDNKFTADNFKLSKLDLYVHRTSLDDLNPKNVEQLSPVAKQILSPQILKTLQQGIPLPIDRAATLVEPELITREGYMLLATDYELDEKKLQEQFKDEFIAAIAQSRPVSK